MFEGGGCRSSSRGWLDATSVGFFSVRVPISLSGSCRRVERLGCSFTE